MPVVDQLLDGPYLIRSRARLRSGRGRDHPGEDIGGGRGGSGSGHLAMMAHGTDKIGFPVCAHATCRLKRRFVG